jgi:hypothetical protein
MRRRHGRVKRAPSENIGDDQVDDEIEKRRRVHGAASACWQIQEHEIRPIWHNWEPARAGSGGQQRVLEYNAGWIASERACVNANIDRQARCAKLRGLNWSESESTAGVCGDDWPIDTALCAKGG